MADAISGAIFSPVWLQPGRSDPKPQHNPYNSWQEAAGVPYEKVTPHTVRPFAREPCHMLRMLFPHRGLHAAATFCTLAVSALCATCPVMAQGTQAEAPDIPTVKISPAVRITPLDEVPLSDTTLKLLNALLRQPLVLSETQVAESARIIAGPDKRVMFGTGDRVYAVGSDFSGQALPLRGQRLRIFRELRPLKDPQTAEVLGQEAHVVGSAVWVQGSGLAQDKESPQAGTMRVPAALEIVGSEQEILVGDHVLLADGAPLEPILPRWPSQPIQARVLGFYASAQQQASQNQIISINQGRIHGLEVGHFLSILSRPVTAQDATDPLKEAWQLPQERTGTALVFMTYERIAYALLTEVTQGVRVGDALAGP